MGAAQQPLSTQESSHTVHPACSFPEQAVHHYNGHAAANVTAAFFMRKCAHQMVVDAVGC